MTSENFRKSKSPNKSIVIQTRQSSSDVQRANLDDYEIEKLIGKGSYALVKLAKNKISGLYFAIKTYERSKLTDPLKKQSVEREISLLRKMSNPYIIGYVNHIVTAS
jgi:serine/threonine protein kinase